jgi:hypothetical protein
MVMSPEQKEIVEEGKQHEAALKTGDADAIPAALAYLIRVTRTQLHSDYVSELVCVSRRSACPGAKPQKAPFTWAAAMAVIGGTATICGTIFAIVH